MALDIMCAPHGDPTNEPRKNRKPLHFAGDSTGSHRNANPAQKNHEKPDAGKKTRQHRSSSVELC